MASQFQEEDKRFEEEEEEGFGFNPDGGHSGFMGGEDSRGTPFQSPDRGAPVFNNLGGYDDEYN